MKLLTKQRTAKLISELERMGKAQELDTSDKSWTHKFAKNSRGDYGYDETFLYQGEEIIKISMDGARLDPRFYVSSDANLHKRVFGHLGYLG